MARTYFFRHKDKRGKDIKTQNNGLHGCHGYFLRFKVLGRYAFRS